MLIMTKTELARAQQRIEIAKSIYGFWVDSTDSIKLKILPQRNFTRIKIISINEVNGLEQISFFCGLQALPKRTDWKSFDFITHLVKTSSNVYIDGIVHMPFSTRKNVANMMVTGNANLSLDFYFVELKRGVEVKTLVGSLALMKEHSPDF